MTSPAPVRGILDEIDVLKAVLANLAVGVAVCDEAGNLIFLNPEAERVLGIELKVPRPPDWVPAWGCYLPDMVTPYPPERFPLARAVLGEEALHELIFIRNSGQPAGVWISVSSRPLRNSGGAIRGGVAVFRDLTETETALRTGIAIHPPPAAQQSVEKGPAWDAYLERLQGYKTYFGRLSSAVEQTADSIIITDTRGVIEYVNPAFEQTTGYPASEVLGKTPSVLKSGHHDERFYRELWEQILSGKPFRGTIINRRKSGELYWAEQTITPIKNDQKQITHFVSVLKDISELRKQQEQEFHLRFAREVQQRFYSTQMSLPGFDVAGTAYPAALTGGDYVDFIQQPDGFVYIVIGDVSGHGFGPALIMATARAYIRAYAKSESDLGSVLSSVNSALATDLSGSQFITLLLVRLDPRGRSMEYAGAGHVPGYLLDASGQTRITMESAGLPCGLFADQVFSSSPVIPLSEGETIVLVTDGVTEAFNEDAIEFGAERILEVVRGHRDQSARAQVQAIYESARAHAGIEAQHDDVTVVVCKVCAAAGAEKSQWLSPGAPPRP
jgi:sigma-B regulation protein RsbU (phosphoserine phosphatase)